VEHLFLSLLSADTMAKQILNSVFFYRKEGGVADIEFENLLMKKPLRFLNKFVEVIKLQIRIQNTKYQILRKICSQFN